MSDLSIKLSKITSGRSEFKVSMRFQYPKKVPLETLLEAISKTISDLGSKTLKIPKGK